MIHTHNKPTQTTMADPIGHREIIDSGSSDIAATAMVHDAYAPYFCSCMTAISRV
jgi:hypothetical protein